MTVYTYIHIQSSELMLLWFVLRISKLDRSIDPIFSLENKERRGACVWET